MTRDLVVDPSRWKDEASTENTGIFVRATLNGEWGSYDIATLDAPSLLAWLRSRGGDNPWAEDVVGILLGHGHHSAHGRRVAALGEAEGGR